MNKATNGYVYLPGSRKEIYRVIYKEGGKYFIKWDGKYVEVINPHGVVTDGWKTIEQY